MKNIHQKITTITFYLCFWLVLHNVVVAQPDAPTGVEVISYDSHLELQWNSNAEPNLSGYRIYRADQGSTFEFLTSVEKINTQHIDFIGTQNQSFDYKITAINTANEESNFSNQVAASTFEMTDEELLTMVQEYTFRYFWDFAHPVSGMARERNTTSTVTSGGSGFGVMAILVGIERRFITQEEGVIRLLKIVNFLETADRFHGVFPHWMNGSTGEVIPFSSLDDGGDLVETAFLIQGLLTARQCINGNSDDEILLRNKITKIWEEVDWNWYRKSVQQVLFWHWSPTHNWEINHEIRGFNEAHIIYLLAIASPTHPIPANLYENGWAANNYANGNDFYNYPLEVGTDKGGPLFFSHYSYMGFDPRNKKDGYTNYFNRNVYHTLINRAYCIENPENHEGYGDNCWGLTASDDPFGYLAHEPIAAKDNGTIAPTAALSSMPFTPELSLAALKHFYRTHGERLWGKYGFYDAFNLTEDWFATSYLAIDQGPIIGMIENHRTQLLWNCFMSNPEIQPALDAIGFVLDTFTVTGLEQVKNDKIGFSIFPNPVSSILDISLKHNTNTYSERIEISLFGFNGKRILNFPKENQWPYGENNITISVADIPSGIYFLHLKTKQYSLTKRLVIVQ